jgi:hypothetical protein
MEGKTVCVFSFHVSVICLLTKTFVYITSLMYILFCTVLCVSCFKFLLYQMCHLLNGCRNVGAHVVTVLCIEFYFILSVKIFTLDREDRVS